MVAAVLWARPRAARPKGQVQHQARFGVFQSNPRDLLDTVQAIQQAVAMQKQAPCGRLGRATTGEKCLERLKQLGPALAIVGVQLAQRRLIERLEGRAAEPLEQQAIDAQITEGDELTRSEQTAPQLEGTPGVREGLRQLRQAGRRPCVAELDR